MKDTTAITTIIVSFIVMIGVSIGLGISADRHTGNNTHKTSIECIRSGKDWVKRYSPGDTEYSDWVCVSPK